MSREKKRFLGRVEAGRRELVELCSKLVQTPSDNPPGDTRAAASLVAEYLEERGAVVKAYEPRPGLVSLVSTVGSGSPHLVLNGHLDQFPADVGGKWSHPPYSGRVEGGRLWGRGSGDMKGGLASLIFCFSTLLEGEPPGKVTLTATADEETGGRWGAYWLLENVQGLVGDGVLNGEPSGLTVRVGEKGRVPLVLRSTGRAAHGSFAGYVGENAIMKMVRVLPHVEALGGTLVEAGGEAGETTRLAMEGYQAQYGHESEEMAEVLRRLTVNIGVIRGGVKDNVVPATCEAEVDIRIPLGVEPSEVRRWVEEAAHRADPALEVGWGRGEEVLTPATYTPVGSPLVAHLKRNAQRATGAEPLISFTSGGTDCRFWRVRGVPAVSYGPRVFNMGGVDEHILVDELATTAQVHMGTILDFLSA